MPQAANSISADQWTLFDKIMYGGLGYGAFCLPSDFFKVIVAIIFPPLGEIINIVEDTVEDTFPYFTWDTLVLLFSNNALTHLVYSLMLTTLFYIPGLVYTLTNIVNKERKVSYDTVSYIYANPKIARPRDLTTWGDVKSGADTAISGGKTGVDKTDSGVKTGYDETASGAETAWNDTIGSLF
jgi:uncharacterized membrane protein YqaE (UPF0057 family)